MRVTPTQLIIDDLYLVNLFKGKSPEFLRSCEHVLETMVTIPDTNPSSDNFVMDRLDSFKSDLISSISSVKPDCSEIVQAVKSSSDSVMSKVESFSQLRNTNRFKGEEGEQTLFDLLQSSFHTHDGYVVKKTNTVAHSCDIVIQRTGFSDIRIESKAYGCDTGSKVNATQVKKFVSDLVKLNTHGIMVSLYSGIVNKSDFDFEIIPTTNKFAMYISGIQNVVDFVRLMYRLDTITQLNLQENTTLLSNENVIKIREHILDSTRKADEIQTHMKNSIRLIKEMTFSSIERLLVAVESDSGATCQTCERTFKNAAGLSQHRCKGKPIDA